MFWPLALCLITGAIVAAPLLPALAEWRRKSDAAPLRIYRKDEGEVRHFARTFRHFVRETMGQALAEASITGQAYDGVTGANLRYHVVGCDGRPALSSKETASHKTDRVLVSPVPLELPDEWMFKGDIFSQGPIFGGEGCIYRALLAEDDIRVAARSIVLRWMHSERAVYVGDDCTLYGRASAEQRLVLGANCRFERLHSRRVELGRARHRQDSTGGEEATGLPYAALLAAEPGKADAAPTRWLVRGDLELPPGTVYQGDLVVTGKVWIGSGSRIAGNLKSNGDMHVEKNCALEGAVVSAADMRIDASCRIRGPVVSESAVRLESAVTIGFEDRPTTLSAPRISAACGVVVHGTVWAREEGAVRSA